LTDTLGLLWGCHVTSANTSDQAGFRSVFLLVLPALWSVVKIYADKGYRGLADWLRFVTGGDCQIEIAQTPIAEAAERREARGFSLSARRWIVERSISWLNWSRRLSKDYEQTTASSRAWVQVSAIRTALRKVAS
jgi:transposase